MQSVWFRQKNLFWQTLRKHSKSLDNFITSHHIFTKLTFKSPWVLSFYIIPTHLFKFFSTSCNSFGESSIQKNLFHLLLLRYLSDITQIIFNSTVVLEKLLQLKNSNYLVESWSEHLLLGVTGRWMETENPLMILSNS